MLMVPYLKTTRVGQSKIFNELLELNAKIPKVRLP